MINDPHIASKRCRGEYFFSGTRKKLRLIKVQLNNFLNSVEGGEEEYKTKGSSESPVSLRKIKEDQLWKAEWSKRGKSRMRPAVKKAWKQDEIWVTHSAGWTQKGGRVWHDTRAWDLLHKALSLSITGWPVGHSRNDYLEIASKNSPTLVISRGPL